jgi:hypothetical protein
MDSAANHTRCRHKLFTVENESELSDMTSDVHGIFTADVFKLKSVNLLTQIMSSWNSDNFLELCSDRTSINSFPRAVDNTSITCAECIGTAARITQCNHWQPRETLRRPVMWACRFSKSFSTSMLQRSNGTVLSSAEVLLIQCFGGGCTVSVMKCWSAEEPVDKTISRIVQLFSRDAYIHVHGLRNALTLHLNVTAPKNFRPYYFFSVIFVSSLLTGDSKSILPPNLWNVLQLTTKPCQNMKMIFLKGRIAILMSILFFFF